MVYFIYSALAGPKTRDRRHKFSVIVTHDVLPRWAGGYKRVGTKKVWNERYTHGTFQQLSSEFLISMDRKIHFFFYQKSSNVIQKSEIITKILQLTVVRKNI